MLGTSEVRKNANEALLSTPTSPSTSTSTYSFRSNAVIFVVVPPLVSLKAQSVTPKSLGIEV